MLGVHQQKGENSFESDSHWFNTVRIPASATEAILGPKLLELRARNYYILGMSLGMLFDISGAPEFLRALTRVLEEWEVMSDGGGSKMVRIRLQTRLAIEHI